MSRPKIILQGQLDKQALRVLAAIHRMEQQIPTHFLYGGALVRIGVKKGVQDGTVIYHPTLVFLDEKQLLNTMKNAADYYRVTYKMHSGKLIETSRTAANPPTRVASLILTWVNDPKKQHVLPFPVLSGIVEMPVLRSDGSILDTPGYDVKTHLYYYTHSSTPIPIIVENPTDEDIQNALALLHEAIGDFPYDTPADKANMLGLLLTPIMRPVIRGSVLMALIDAPKHRTGKSLAADVVATICTGQPAAMSDLPASRIEMHKLLTSTQRQKSAYCLRTSPNRPVAR
jgi:hypothetical protein